ncbi:hypothetical protein EV424DRAFT_1395219 [Suillus variegatus]|nr:hypothetical protein EV424DRAFT_1395219 [Suillus variegatus]
MGAMQMYVSGVLSIACLSRHVCRTCVYRNKHSNFKYLIRNYRWTTNMGWGGIRLFHGASRMRSDNMPNVVSMRLFARINHIDDSVNGITELKPFPYHLVEHSDTHYSSDHTVVWPQDHLAR